MATWFWDDVRSALAGAPRGTLIEPEAVDRAPPRPWWRLPPGAALFLGLGGALLVLAGAQAGAQAVQREGAAALARPLQETVQTVRQLAARDGAPRKRPGELRRAVRELDGRWGG